jgi:glycosyltransferase involved in cell wall biosynthesis
MVQVQPDRLAQAEFVTCDHTIDGVLQDGYRNRLLQREEMDGIRILRTWMYLAANRGFGRRILNYLSFMLTAIFASFFAPRCDLVIGTSPQFFTACAAWVIATVRRRPFVFEVRDLWPESIVAVGAMRSTAPGFNPGKCVISMLQALARFLYRRAARIVVLTDSFRRVLESYGVPSDKIRVVTNGVDLALFRPGERYNRVRQELGVGGEFVASYVGTLGMAHGLETVLDAAEGLRRERDIRFLIMGSGAEKEHLEALALKRDLENIVLIDRQPHDRMPEFLAASDACLVLLRKAELFKTVIPSKLFEAMGAARPIILGVQGEAEAIVREGECGIVIEPENAAELAAAVRELKEDPSRATRLGENGRVLARRSFSRDALADQYAAILQDMLPPVLGPAISTNIAEWGVRGGEVAGAWRGDEGEL